MERSTKLLHHRLHGKLCKNNGAVGRGGGVGELQQSGWLRLVRTTSNNDTI